MSEDQEIVENVTTYSETVLDMLVDSFHKFRSRDRAEGGHTDEGALGGIGYLVDVAKLHGPTDAGILLALAVRRLADQGVTNA